VTSCLADGVFDLLGAMTFVVAVFFNYQNAGVFGGSLSLSSYAPGLSSSHLVICSHRTHGSENSQVLHASVPRTRTVLMVLLRSGDQNQLIALSPLTYQV
jgi:hypothetical protein